MAVGLKRPVETSHLRLLERRAAEVGVDAAIETIDGLAYASLTDLLRERGYVSAGETSVLVRSPTEPLAEIDPSIDIAEVRDADVAEWAALSAEGWGHLEPGPRAANDRFADVAHASGTPGLLIARERSSGRGIACADLHVDGEAAILGGASTIPSDRGKGAQSALVVYRLLVAQQMRAAVAITTTEPGSQSERNLVRLGFEHSHTKRMWTRSAMQQPPQIEPEFGGADTC